MPIQLKLRRSPLVAASFPACCGAFPLLLLLLMTLSHDAILVKQMILLLAVFWHGGEVVCGGGWSLCRYQMGNFRLGGPDRIKLPTEA